MKKPTTKKGKMAKVSKVMKEFKAGSLHSGKGGKIVKSPKQAIAIALSSANMSKKKGK
jgi:ribosomal protein L21E